MKIVICSVAPVFLTEFHGGSGRVLADVAVALGTAGHDVEILCTRRNDNYSEFYLHSKVKVRPVLRFKETYPEPFYVPPHHLAEIVQIIRSASDAADVMYVHDGELPFHFLYDQLPTVISFQDFVYPDTLSSAMSFERDVLIVASDYVKRCVEDTIGQYRMDLAGRVHVVPNGVNLDLFRAGDPLEWQSDLVRKGFYLIGCPHRPDPAKGLREGVQLVAKLKTEASAGERQPMLLVPRWIDSRINPNDGHVYRTLYDSLMEEAAQLGASENLYVHDWIAGADIARYYSGCDIVVAIGSFVEAFGNVPVEAAACGTPSIVAQVAGHVGKLLPCVSTEVPPGDIDAACAAVTQMLHADKDYDAVRKDIGQRYGLKQMVDGYRHVIENVTRLKPLPLRPNAPRKNVKLATWCRFIKGRLYNDYHKEYLDDALLRTLFDKLGDDSVARINRIHVDLIEPGRLAHWMKGGYVVECE